MGLARTEKTAEIVVDMGGQRSYLPYVRNLSPGYDCTPGLIEGQGSIITSPKRTTAGTPQWMSGASPTSAPPLCASNKRKARNIPISMTAKKRSTTTILDGSIRFPRTDKAHEVKKTLPLRPGMSVVEIAGICSATCLDNQHQRRFNFPREEPFEKRCALLAHTRIFTRGMDLHAKLEGESLVTLLSLLVQFEAA